MQHLHWKAVLFDFDGVICQTEVYRLDYREKQLKRFGIPVNRKALYAMAGTSPAEKRPRGARLDALFGEYEAYRQHREELISFPQLEYHYDQLMTPGLPEVLQMLQDAGLRLAVASNSSTELLETALAECGIRDFFQLVVSGWDMEHKKPDPYIYQWSMEQLGVCPEECAVVEDSQVGIQAGKAAGATVFALRDRDGLLDQSGYDGRMMRITELPRLLGLAE